MSDASKEPVDFEDVVAALLKVDPKGLSGKHKKDAPSPADTEDEAK